MLKQKVSSPAVACCIMVICGFLFGLSDIKEDNISFSVVSVGLIASLFVSLFAIFTQSALKSLDNNSWLLQSYNNINAIFLILPLLIFTGESSTLINTASHIFSFQILSSLILSGILGFLIGICSNLQISYTSALTHNISGTAKACVQTLVAVIVNRESHSFGWWLGSGLVIIGSAAYSYVRNKEMMAKRNDPL